MHFRLDVKKVVQAIGVLFREDGVDRMAYMRVLKLLYIADRITLAETGRPITGGPVYAMKRGPVLTEVYDLIQGQHLEMPVWDTFFQKQRYSLQLRGGHPDVGALSKYEIKKLQEVAALYADCDEFQLSEETHKFPEWINNDLGSSAKRISLQEILEAVGRGDEAAAIIQEAKELTCIHDLLGK